VPQLQRYLVLLGAAWFLHLFVFEPLLLMLHLFLLEPTLDDAWGAARLASVPFIRAFEVVLLYTKLAFRLLLPRIHPRASTPPRSPESSPDASDDDRQIPFPEAAEVYG